MTPEIAKGPVKGCVAMQPERFDPAQSLGTARPIASVLKLNS
jgi:hypothetical protein